MKNSLFALATVIIISLISQSSSAEKKVQENTNESIDSKRTMNAITFKQFEGFE
jgi:hypothetical protein